MSSKITKEADEDEELKEELKTLVEKIVGNDEQLKLPALEMMRYLIRTATTSMTSVPKPLKYLAEHYNRIKTSYDKVKNIKIQKVYCDIISVLAMSTAGTEEAKDKRDCLNYCLKGTMNDVGDWGHEYVRQLEDEIVEEWALSPERTNELLPLVHNIVKFDAKHHAEIQACDLLMEIDRLEILAKHITTDTYQRICLYLASCANYVDDVESEKILRFVLDQYKKFKEYTRALIIAMQIHDDKEIQGLFTICKDKSILRQMAYISGRQQVVVDLPESIPEIEKEELHNISSNTYLNSLFHLLGRELDIMEPKTPDDIYKSWLEPTPLRNSLLADNVDSARQNLASSFANAFINAGFSRDKLVTIDDGSKWIYRNKEHGMLSATASLGLIHLWDVDGGLTPIDKYLYTNDDNIKAGALLALGIVNCRVSNECDPALALLSDYVEHNTPTLQIGAIFGLGLAYVGTNRENVTAILLPVILSQKSSPEVIAIASVACGMINVSSCNNEVSTTILQRLIDSIDSPLLSNTYTRFILLGLGLCYLGRKEAIETPTAALEVFHDPFKTMSQTVLQMCAYAGSGDVLIIQEFLHICSERYVPPASPTTASTASQESCQKPVAETTSTTSKKDKTDKDKKGKSDKKSDKRHKKEKKEKNARNEFCEIQAVAAIGVALVAMSEDTGSEMCQRIFGHMVRYGDACMRKTVPLAMALCSISNPQMSMLDILNKYSHDSDDEVSYNAIFALGLIGAGSNNARLATMLRQLAGYHSRNPGQLFMVRIAQGMCHMGKGTLTLNPYHTDKQIFCTTALAGLLVTITALVDSPHIIFGKRHYLIYALAAAMQPRWLITLDENLEQISVPVRVGQAVDIVAKAGTPKTIAGIHTHSTPVLLAVGERAELATDQYEQLSPVMEGIIILRKKEEKCAV